MGNRTQSREYVLQALFYMDMNQENPPKLTELFCECFSPSERAIPFFLELFNGVISMKPDLDKTIERFSDNWKISRMSCVDRNALRISVYELMYCQDIPPKVSINEAINLGKKFGTEESGAFINGILDRIRIELEKEKNK